MRRQRAVYLVVALLIFCIELLIATRLRHLGFVRSSLGDVLAVMLLYYLVLSLRGVDRIRLAAGVFLFACVVELSQYFHLARVLGLKPGSALRIALGDTFQWGDILCYLVGSAAAFAADSPLRRRIRRTAPVSDMEQS